MPESAVEEASASSAPFDEMAHELIRFARDGQLAECKRLLREAPDVPLLLGFCDGCWSALAWASSEGHLEIVTLLLDHGAAEALISSPADADEPLTTPLHWAAFEGHLRIVWLLLVRGFPPNIPDSEQNTALHLAATGGHADILKTLLSVGAHASAKNTYGNTALQLTKPSSECRELLYAAAKASQDGRRFLCTCSGEFVAEVDSVHSIVVDRTSKPTPRPVRYSSHCYGRIQAAERELHAQTQNAPVGTDTAALAAAIASAERIGAAVGLIDTATAALLRLEARLDMGARAAEVDALRPLETAAPTTLLLESVSLARERGVELKLVENAEQLIRVAQAELVLRECTERCMPHQMVDDPEMQLGPAADSELATRAEAAVEELADALQGVKALEPRKHLVAEGERVYRKLCAEAQLRRAVAMPKEIPAEDVESGMLTWTHLSGEISTSLLDSLGVHVQGLEGALETCIVENVAPGIVAAAQEELKSQREHLERVQIEEEERKAREAAAIAKKAKKAKKAKQQGKGKKTSRP